MNHILLSPKLFPDSALGRQKHERVKTHLAVSLGVKAVEAGYSVQFMTLVTWNVESGGALQSVVADRIAAFQGVDIWGLSEVYAIDAEAYEFGAEDGEGADYDSLLGSTGQQDRLLLMWDTTRFERVNQGELLTIGETGRAPLWVQLSDRRSGQEFIVMVNHLHRSNEGIRHRQATALNTWATQQTLPVIALGDFNFDWNLPNGEADHDLGYDNFTANGVWEWIRPTELVTTQCSGWPCGFNSVLGFVFVAGPAREWNITSEIIVVDGDFPDDRMTPDHRPVIAYIAPVEEQPVSNAGNAGNKDAPQPILEGAATEPIPPTNTPPPTATATTPPPPPITPTFTPPPTPDAPPPQNLSWGKLFYDGAVPDVESDEYIEIINNGASVNLSGWVLPDDNGSVFVFPTYDIGTVCRVYTNEFHPEHCGFSFGSGRAIWGNSGDMVELVNPSGVVVDTGCWKSGC